MYRQIEKSYGDPGAIHSAGPSDLPRRLPKGPIHSLRLGRTRPVYKNVNTEVCVLANWYRLLQSTINTASLAVCSIRACSALSLPLAQRLHPYDGMIIYYHNIRVLARKHNIGAVSFLSS